MAGHRSIAAPRRSRQPLRAGLVAIARLSVPLALLVSLFAGYPLDSGSYWIALPLIAAATFLALLLIFVLVVLVATLARRRRMRSEAYVLGRARKLSGEEGTVVRTGPFTIWSSERADLMPAIEEQHAVVRDRFEARLGASLAAPLPLRVLCFDRRGPFLAIHGQALDGLEGLDGLYAPGPARVLTLTTEVPPYRLVERERVLRTLFTYHALETSKGFLPRPWLQMGIAGLIAAGGEDSARLNRKMTVALARGDALPTEAFFGLTAMALMRLVKGWDDRRSFAKFWQFTWQAGSLLEYLCGADAPAERCEPFRAFFRDVPRKGSYEEIFKNHHGYGFDALIERWRAWVQGRGIGPQASPPAPIREALARRILPIIEDRRAGLDSRIRAVREVGRAGYTFGAGILVDLLRLEDEVPRDEVVWTLEAVSGMPHGDDTGRWAAWWNALPPQMVSRP